MICACDHHNSVVALKAISFVEEVRARCGCDDCVNIFENEETRRECSGCSKDAADGVGIIGGLDIEKRDRHFAIREVVHDG